MDGSTGRECILDAATIREIVQSRRFKQWWIAEQLGVHRKTVSRWVNGTVRRTTREMATALAGVLRVSAKEITVASEPVLVATADDQLAAPELLRGASLLDRLGPVGQWETLEKLLKSAVVSGLSDEARGDLLNNLSIALWRQDKIAAAAEYASAARQLGEYTELASVLLPALLSLANIASWQGNVGEALELYKRCIRDAPGLDPRRLGAALNNYAAVLWEAGEAPESLAPARRAIELFERHGTPMNLSIAHAQMALILLEQDDLVAAPDHVRFSMAFAEQAEYSRGVCLAHLLQAEVDARTGRRSEAREHVRRGLACFEELAIAEGQNFEIAARTLRLANSLDEAEKLVERGLDVVRDFPVERAALERERGAIRLATRDYVGAREAYGRARDLYEQCGCRGRVREIDDVLRVLS